MNKRVTRGLVPGSPVHQLITEGKESPNDLR